MFKIKSKKICVVDICGTIYRENTTYAFLENYIKYKKKNSIIVKLFNSKFVRIFNSLLFKIINIDFLRLFSVKIIRNEKREKLVDYSFYLIDYFLTPITVTQNLLRSLKKDDYGIILISASFDFIVEAVADKLDVQEWYATQLKYHNNLITGDIEFDIYGQKHQIIDKHRNGIEELIVITDNLSDKDLVCLASKTYVLSKKKNVEFWRNLKNVEILELI